MRKVNLDVIRPWVTKKVIELIGFEDEFLAEYAVSLLEDDTQPVRFPHYRSVQAHKTSFVDSRPAQNADKSYRLSHEQYPYVHD